MVTGERFDIPRKQWTCCQACAGVLKNKVMDRVKLFFLGMTGLYFVTLTIRDDRKLERAIERFYHELRRDHPELYAFWLKEFQRRGARHLHLIWNIEMTRRELKKRWRKATRGDGYQVDISEVTTVRNAAGYMMKYMTKQLDGEHAYENEGLRQFDKGERRYGFWKPKGVKVPKAPELARAGAEGDQEIQEIEVDLDPHWNPGSRYWLKWYNDCYTEYGEAFHRFMEYSTLSDIKKARYMIKNEELNFDSPSYGPMFTWS